VLPERWRANARSCKPKCGLVILDPPIVIPPGPDRPGGAERAPPSGLFPLGPGEGSAPVDGHDEPLFPQLGHRPADSHPGHAVLCCQLGLTGQPAIRPDTPGADLLGKIAGNLVGYRCGRITVDLAGTIVERHRTIVEVPLTCEDNRLRPTSLMRHPWWHIERLCFGPDRLRAENPGWRLWYVPNSASGHVTWCAQPLPLLNCGSPRELREEIAEARREAVAFAGQVP